MKGKFQRFEKTICLLLAAVLAISLSACSGETGANSQQEPSKGSSAVSAADTGTGDEENEYYKVYPQDTAGTIEFYQQKPEVEDWYASIIEEFQELYPNIVVEQNVQQDASSVLQTRVASGEFTDVWLYWPTDAVFSTFQANDWLMDVTEEPFVKYSSENVQKLYEFDGKMYGVPIAMNTAGIICNKGMFEENGIELPNTWDSFIGACRAFQEKGIAPLVLTVKAGAETGNNMIWGNYVTGEQVKQIARGELKFSEVEGWSEAVDKILEVYSYAQPNAVSTDYNDGITNFANEEGAMFLSGNWTFNSIQAINPELEIVQVPMPAGEGKVCSGVDVGLSIGAKTEYPEACKAFVNFLSSKPIAERFCNDDSAIPAIRGVVVKDTRAAAMVEAINEGKSFNWPNHFFPAGGASDAYSQRVTTLFIDRDKEAFLQDVDDIMSGKK